MSEPGGLRAEPGSPPGHFHGGRLVQGAAGGKGAAQAPSPPAPGSLSISPGLETRLEAGPGAAGDREEANEVGPGSGGAQEASGGSCRCLHPWLPSSGTDGQNPGGLEERRGRRAGRQDQPQGQFRPQAATQGESQGPQPHVGMEQGVSPSDRDSAGQGQRTLTSSSDSSFPWTSPPCMTSCRVGPGPDVGPHSARKSLGQRQVQHRWLRRSPSGRRVPLWVRASCSGPSVGPPLADESGVHPAVCLVAGVDSGGSGEQVLLGGACSPTRQGQKHGGRRGTQRSSSCSTQLMGQGTQCGEPQPHPVGARPRPTPNRSPRFTIRL